MYETTIKGFKIRLTNSLRDGLLKEWDPGKVKEYGDRKICILEKEQRCVLCRYDIKHYGGGRCKKCPLFGFKYGGDTGCDALFRCLLRGRASYSLGSWTVTFFHTLKTSRRYVQKIRDTILAMKKV